MTPLAPPPPRPPWLGLCAKRMAGRGEAGWTPRAQRRPGRALRGVLRPPPRARGQRWASLPGGPAASPAPDSVFSANPLDSPCAAMGCLPPSPGPGGAWCVAGAHWVPVSESPAIQATECWREQVCDVRREHALCTRVSGLLDGRHRCDEGWAQKRLHVRPRTRCSCRPAWSFLAAFGKRRRFPLPQAAGFLTPPGPRGHGGLPGADVGQSPRPKLRLASQEGCPQPRPCHPRVQKSL